MSGKGRAGLVLIVLGIALLIAALSLWQNNRHEALEAEESAREVMDALVLAMEGRETQETEIPAISAADLPEEAGQEIDTHMDTVEIDGNRYIGFLTIPDLSLELPVMETWDYERLKIAPCRYSGTLLGNDLVIAAHIYLRHFGHLMDLPIGAEVLFTDVKGNTVRYEVSELKILQPTDIESMTAGEYDLTLFTCTYGGATRFTVRCERAGNDT